MRLREKEIQSIVAVLDGYFDDAPGALYLFGSRADDRLRGGDIDLLLVTTEERAAGLSLVRIKIIVQIQKRIGERKTDLKVISSEGAKKDPFVASILPGAALIKQWGS